MKNRFLILTLIGLLGLAVPANAELTSDDITSPEYLETHGYSEALIKAAQKTKARANGEEYATYEKDTWAQNKPLKYIRHFFMYIDPAYDDESFMEHNIKTSPTYRDL